MNTWQNKNLCIRLLLVVICLLFYLYGSAQDYNNNRPSIVVEHLGTDKGLSQSMVTEIAVDQKGYVWTATKDGLNRYDGVSFKVYRYIPGDTTSLTADHIVSVYADSRGLIWVATVTGDIDCFDPATERFEHIIKRRNTDKATRPRVHEIFEDVEGNICIGSERWFKIVSLIDPKLPVTAGNVKINDAIDVYHFLDKADIPDTSRIIDVACTYDGSYAVYTYDSLYIFTKDAIAKQEKPHTLAHEHNSTDWRYIDGINSRLFLYKEEWLQVYDNNDKAFKPLLKVSGFEIVRDAPYMGASGTDKEGRLWFMTYDNYNMIFCIYPDGKRIDTINLNWQYVHQNHRDHADDIAVDMNGNIWVGTVGYGMYKFNTRQLRFTIFNSIATKEWGTFKDGNMFVRTAVQGNSKLFDKEIIDKWYQIVYQNKLIYEETSHLVYSPDSFYWMADHPQNGMLYLYKYKIHEGVANREKALSMPAYGGSLEGPFFIDNEGTLWFMVSQNHSADSIYLYHYVEQYKKIEQFAFPADVTYLGYRFIGDWYQESSGVIWLGTSEGVFSFDPKAIKWKYYENKLANKYDKPSAAVLSICADPNEPQRFVWVGTHGAGMYKLDRQTGIYTQFSIKDGLPNNVVYSIMDDSHHNLWIATNNGLCLFDPQTFSTRNMSTHHGLPDNEFNRYRCAKDRNGKHYYSTVGGYIYFNPEDFYKYSQPSKVVINKLEIPNQKVIYSPSQASADSGYVLNKPLEYTDKLVFDHSQNMFKLRFALLDLSVPEKNKYKYMLEGFNDEWIDAGTNNEATFTNLSPGSYTFKVIGCNSENVWSDVPAVMDIIILPPWWATWWFRLFVAFLIAAILYGIYRIRVQQMLHVERMRNDIAQDLHDEIGSTLSSTALYMTVIQKTINNIPAKANALLEKVIDNTSEMMENMNDIVWATKTDNDSLQKLINRMRAFAVNTSEAKGILLNFNVDVEYDEKRMTMEQRKNVYLFFKEVVNNAIKHADCNTIDVNIIASKSKFRLEVTDDGIGFEVSKESQKSDALGGNGLQGMRVRAEHIGAEIDIKSKLGAGTSITLMLKVR